MVYIRYRGGYQPLQPVKANKRRWMLEKTGETLFDIVEFAIVKAE